MTKKSIILTFLLLTGFSFYMLAQGPPPPPSQSGGPAGVPLDGASGMLILGALGFLFRKYLTSKDAVSKG